MSGDITFTDILSQIGRICRQLDLPVNPETPRQSIEQTPLVSYLVALQAIKNQLAQYQSLQEEYAKLEDMLQKQETELRKKIGAQQQLKLYTDALKAEVEELEHEKIQLLNNSKAYIKQLKGTNQKLYQKLYKIQNRKTSKTSKEIAASPTTKPHKKRSHTQGQSIARITKTQHIERQPSGLKGRKGRGKQKHLYSSVTALNNPKSTIQNAHIQVIERVHTKREKNLTKKRANMFSNYTLLTFLEANSHNRLRKNDKVNNRLSPSPPVRLVNRKEEKQRHNMSRHTEGRVNRSEFSIHSQVHPNRQKQTI